MTNPPGAMPPLPSNLPHVVRRIRACESEVPAQVVFEHALKAYAAPLLARVAELQADLARTERNRGMWKQQCFVQAVDLAEMRKNSTRYLWLRERNAVLNDGSIFTAKRVQNEDGSFSHNDLIANEEMDAAIDAALTPTKD